MADANYYELLGVEPEATPEEIRSAFLELVKRVHPDRGGNQALFRSVKGAYETLSDPARRAAYDRNNFVDQSVPSADAAPGWRRTDDPSSADDRQSAKSDSGVYDEPTSGQSTTEPPPNPPPAPSSASPTSHSPSANDPPSFEAAHGVLLARVAANPSVALLLGGVVVLMVGARLSGPTGNLLFLGFVAAVVGFVGVLGRHKAARREAQERSEAVPLDALTDAEFHQRLQAAFQHVGYTVYHLGSRGDYGADLVLDVPGFRTVVHAKQWYATVGPEAVREVVASRAHYNAQYAIVVTSERFTDGALTLARSSAVEMWDRERLARLLVAHELGPPRTGFALLGEELRAGAPRALRGGVTVVVALLAASAASSRLRRRGRR